MAISFVAVCVLFPMAYGDQLHLLDLELSPISSRPNTNEFGDFLWGPIPTFVPDPFSLALPNLLFSASIRLSWAQQLKPIRLLELGLTDWKSGEYAELCRILFATETKPNFLANL